MCKKYETAVIALDSRTSVTHLSVEERTTAPFGQRCEHLDAANQGHADDSQDGMKTVSKIMHSSALRTAIQGI